MNSSQEIKRDILLNSKTLSASHSPNKLDRQSEVSDTAGPVSFHQYVLTLQVPVSNGRFALGSKDLSVEVTKA